MSNKPRYHDQQQQRKTIEGALQDTESIDGYPKKFVNRAIVKQIRRHGLPDTDGKQDDEANSMVIASIPFIDGISQEVRRIVREAGVKCVFSTESTLESLYCNKDPLPRDSRM